jgi:disulfide bond formation protein DsbB
MNFFRVYGLYAAWTLTLIGLFISLYFSEIEQEEPCHLCWLQRIALFPLVIQLGIATYRSEPTDALHYCLPLVLIGFFVGAYQSILPEIGLGSLCGCAASPIPLLFKKIPLPWVSTGGFFLIALLLLLSRKNRESPL